MSKKRMYVVDKSNDDKNKIVIKTKVWKLPNKLHLSAQQSYKACVFKDKTKYNRKVKHKGRYYD